MTRRIIFFRRFATKNGCHEGAKARSKKMCNIFLLCLGDFVAKFFFVKKGIYQPFKILVISNLSKPLFYINKQIRKQQ